MHNSGSPKETRTAAVDDYLKAIWQLGGERETVVGMSGLARALRVSAASTTEMVQRLAEQRLVRYTPRRGVDLTPAGRRIALRVVRTHRVVEVFLARVLGLAWEKVHDEADRWEHVVSDEVVDRMEAAAGRPTTDVHGHPIPDAEGRMPPSEDMPLDELEVGQPGVVTQVSDHSPELLRYLGRIGLRPGVQLSLRASEPFGGAIDLEVGRRRRRLGTEAAAHVRVTPRGARRGGGR